LWQRRLPTLLLLQGREVTRRVVEPAERTCCDEGVESLAEAGGAREHALRVPALDDEQVADVGRPEFAPQCRVALDQVAWNGRQSAKLVLPQRPG
jgi:hypothetical protein